MNGGSLCQVDLVGLIGSVLMGSGSDLSEESVLGVEPAIIKLWRAAWEEFIPFPSTTSRSERSSVQPTRSKAATAATGEPCEPEGTSRPTRPRGDLVDLEVFPHDLFQPGSE